MTDRETIHGQSFFLYLLPAILFDSRFESLCRVTTYLCKKPGNPCKRRYTRSDQPSSSTEKKRAKHFALFSAQAGFTGRNHSGEISMRSTYWLIGRSGNPSCLATSPAASRLFRSTATSLTSDRLL